MQPTPKAVLGMYPTRAGVEFAVEAFREAGFRNANISLVLPEKMPADDHSAERPRTTAEIMTCDNVEVAVLDGPLASLREVSPATVPGEGTFLIAGPIAQSLGGVTEECPPAELATALMHLGIPECETGGYTDRVLRGKALLSVQCDSAEEAAAARRLHGDLGGMDVFAALHSEHALTKLRRAMACSAAK
jgi:hypothetical protein